MVMRMAYRPSEIENMRTPMKLRVVDRYEKVNGVSKPIYKDATDPIFHCNFKTYGGTETTVNGRYVLLDTAIITTWYRPDITSNCQVIRLSDNAVFEIKNEPENIEQSNQYLKFKIERIKGKA